MVLVDFLQLAADPAEQLARARALLLYTDIGLAYGQDAQRWASIKDVASIMARVVLPYALKQLSDWLSSGGMALGAPLPCACTETGCLH